MSADHQRGVSLIEMMIAITILAILTMLAVPSYSAWMQNNRIRTAAESIADGLNLARAEALRRNTVVRFDLVSSLDASCALSSTPTAWVVARGNPAGSCGLDAASQTDASAPTGADPKIIQKTNLGATIGNTVITASNGANAATSVLFDGLGRISNATLGTTATRIAITNPALSTSDARPLDVRVTAAGQVRVCDPKVADTTDPRACGGN